MTIAQKEDVVNTLEEMKEEGIMFFTSPDLMKRLGYKDNSKTTHMRRILRKLESEGMIIIEKVGNVNIYKFPSAKIQVPFFEKPLGIQEVQSFFDRFYNDISKMLVEKAGEEHFSLYFKGNNIYLKKIEVRPI